MKMFQKKNFFYLILILSFLSLVAALYIEIILEYNPCKLCLYQRIPYILAILVALFGIVYNSKLSVYLIFIIFLFSIFLSGYHVGIENEIFSESSVCSDQNLKTSNKKDLLSSLSELPISCKDVNFKIFGLSLATINLIISSLICVYSRVLFKNEKN